MDECGKLKHPSEQAARRAARTMHNRVRVYYCQPCGAYHLTHGERGDPTSVTRPVRRRARVSRFREYDDE